MSVIKFQRERIQGLWDELAPLLEQHWREVAFYQDIPLAPDTEVYGMAEDAGRLRCFTAREDGKLIGYSFYFVQQHPHYVGSKVAQQDVIFVDPAKRRGTLGARLIAWCDEQLRAEHVQVVTHHVKVAPHLDFGRLLERMGYEPTDTLWSKRLDR
jgi:GNAT superfamily N-acetyltransferase